MATAKHQAVSALGSGLRNLVGILSGSALVLSPDTGPLHMAVALEHREQATAPAHARA